MAKIVNKTQHLITKKQSKEAIYNGDLCKAATKKVLETVKSKGKCIFWLRYSSGNGMGNPNEPIIVYSGKPSISCLNKAGSLSQKFPNCQKFLYY